MTTVHIKKKHGRVIVKKYDDKVRQTQDVRGNVQGQGTRVHEIKQIDSRKVSPQQRVKRLTQLAHELGPEKLIEEIAVHRRKITDLEEALAAYEKEKSNG